MRAYKCNICGNLFEESKLLEIAKMKSVIVTFNDQTWVGTHDICPDCIAAIQGVIDERAEKVGKVIRVEKQREIIGTSRGFWRGKVEDEFFDSFNGEWIIGNLEITQFPNGITDYAIRRREYGNITPLSVDHSTLGECTGLIDKYGIEIFEGDIVRFVYNDTEHICAVIWDADDLTFKVVKDLENYNKGFIYFSYCEEIEIIGNIHDSSDLLKQ